MSNYPYRQNEDEFKDLLQQYLDLKSGKSFSFIDEESFEELIGYFFEEKNDLPAALEAAETGTAQFPYSAAMQLQKADILIGLNRLQEALTSLHNAELLDRTDITLYILKTEVFLLLDMEEKATEVLEEAQEIFEGEEKTDLLFELADVYDYNENFDRVFDCLKLILINDPTNDEALHQICYWTDHTGRNEESINLHQKILDDYPFSHLAWFNLAAAYQGIKLYEKAIDAYKYCTAIDEKFDFAYRNMGDAYLRLRQYKEAIEVLEKVIELAPPEDVIFEAIGHCNDKLKNFSLARLYYHKASQLVPADSQLYYKIACTYISEQNWDSAIKNLENACNIHPGQFEYNLALGKCYWVRNKLEYAIDSLKMAISIKPKNPAGWAELLNLLYTEEYFEDGLEYTKLAYENTGKKPLFLFYQSIMLLELGKTKEAMRLLQEGMDKNPRLIKKIIDINPTLLQHRQIVELIASYKRKKSR